jgi:hypothetical protein
LDVSPLQDGDQLLGVDQASNLFFR